MGDKNNYSNIWNMLRELEHARTRANLREALLRRQYLPAVRKNESELPPLFSTISLTDELSARLSQFHSRSFHSSPSVKIRTRRYDGRVRLLGLPHPVFYSRLVQELVANWAEIEKFLESKHSKIRPEWHPSDGRYIIMDYDVDQERHVENSIMAQNCRYRVTADVSNFFPSVYSHSIDWALRGIEEAKANRNTDTWQSRLDKCVQACSYGETSGIPIGPAASNIISEIVLQRVDEELSGLGFDKFVRYVDDYTAYFETLEGAENFIHRLDRSLADYRLQLNSRKTNIYELSRGFGEPWLIEINRSRIKGRSARALTQYLQYCEILSQNYPNASVLKYGAKTVLRRQKCPNLHEKIKKKNRPKRGRDVPVLHEFVRLSYFHPHLLMHLAAELRYCEPILTDVERMEVRDRLNKLLADATRRGETDSCLWLIYCLVCILHENLSESLILELVTLGDDLINISLLSLVSDAKEAIRMYVEDIPHISEITLLEHWLVRYEAFRVGLITNSSLHPNLETGWFNFAKKSNLKFTAD